MILVARASMAAFCGKQTLQAMCLFKLVNELENYTPDAIFTQLPPTLRRMLLLNLPAVDIIRLESTSVARARDQYEPCVGEGVQTKTLSSGHA